MGFRKWLLRDILKGQEALMTKVDDLNASVEALANAVALAVAAIEKELVIIAGGNTDQAMDAAIERIRGFTTTLTEEAAKVA